MRPASARFLAAVAEPHTLAVRVALLQDGEEVDTLDTLGGTVTLDGNAATRGTVDLAFADDGTLGLVPDTPASPLAPYGNELRVERGIEYLDGTIETIPLGVFRINDVDVNDTDDGLHIRVTGQDRSARIIDARFEAPYQVAAATPITDAIADTIGLVYPEVVTNFATTSLTTPQVIAEEGGDRWAFCQQIATGAGMELFFDGDGELVLRPVTPPAGSPVTSLVEGEDGVLLEAARKWSRQGAFNRVIATGENTSETAPVRGVATDDNPNSPTYYYGPFGPCPRFYSSPFITTADQAASAAQAILSRELGTTQSVDFGTVVNPALEPGDVIRVTRERAGIDEDDVIDTLSIPLAAEGAMSGTTRATQVFG